MRREIRKMKSRARDDDGSVAGPATLTCGEQLFLEKTPGRGTGSVTKGARAESRPGCRRGCARPPKGSLGGRQSGLMGVRA